MKRLWIAVGAALIMAAGAADAQAGDQPYRLSAQAFRDNLAHPKNGIATSLVPTGRSGANVNTVRRDKTGEVELHGVMNDIVVAHDGHAVVPIGDHVAGDRQTGPQEWRGGTIQDAKAYDMRPGDVLWIPAGHPHQVVVKAGESFSYLCAKAPNPPGVK